MKNLFFLFTLVVASYIVNAQGRLIEQLGNLKEVRENKNDISLIADNALVNIMLYSPDIVKVRIVES
jgi:ribosomal protein S16